MLTARPPLPRSVGAAALTGLPMGASAYNLADKRKAQAIFGQKVLALQSASAEEIADNSAAIITYAGQMIRASGKRNVDGRKLTGPIGEAANAALAAAKKGDTAGASAGLKELAKVTQLTKIPPYGSPQNPFTGGVTFTSMSGTTGTPGSW